MREEEKKAIEYLKNNHIPVLRYDNYGNILEPLYYGIEEKEILLNLIKKLQKENEELKEKVFKRDKKLIRLEEYANKNFERKDDVKANYIPKDKVIELDNECFPRHKVGLFKGQRIMGTNECTYFAKKMLELLEEDE